MCATRAGSCTNADRAGVPGRLALVTKARRAAANPGGRRTGPGSSRRFPPLVGVQRLPARPRRLAVPAPAAAGGRGRPAGRVARPTSVVRAGPPGPAASMSPSTSPGRPDRQAVVGQPLGLAAADPAGQRVGPVSAPYSPMSGSTDSAPFPGAGRT